MTRSLNPLELWWISIPAFSPFREKLLEILSAEERNRAAAFRVLAAKDRYISTRVVLRILLSHYSQQDPAAILICSTRSGKPYASGHSLPHFSVSHSGDLALLAFGASGIWRFAAWRRH